MKLDSSYYCLPQGQPQQQNASSLAGLMNAPVVNIMSRTDNLHMVVFNDSSLIPEDGFMLASEAIGNSQFGENVYISTEEYERYMSLGTAEPELVKNEEAEKPTPPKETQNNELLSNQSESSFINRPEYHKPSCYLSSLLDNELGLPSNPFSSLDFSILDIEFFEKYGLVY